MRDDFFSALPGYPVAVIGGRWYGQATDFVINPKGAVPVNETTPTPMERLGHLRAAIEDAEDLLLEGRLTAASERLADAKGIATHLTCRAEEFEAAFAPPTVPPAWMAFPEAELRAAIAKVASQPTLTGDAFADAVLQELLSKQPKGETPPTNTEFPFRAHLAGIDLFEALSRIEALEEAGATLVRELAGKDPAWWVRAAGALGELERLAVDKDGA
jgi:hypothetical protein